MVKLTLPTDSTERKNVPILSGVMNYFPAALAGVARISVAGNNKHNADQPLHHARGKSMDHGDCIIRHTMDLEDLRALMVRQEKFMDADQAASVIKLLLEEARCRAWRALADLQELEEIYGGAPLAPGARLPETQQDAEPDRCQARADGYERCQLSVSHKSDHLFPAAGGLRHVNEAQTVPMASAVALTAYQIKEQRAERAMRSRVEGEKVPAGPDTGR